MNCRLCETAGAVDAIHGIIITRNVRWLKTVMRGGASYGTVYSVDWTFLAKNDGNSSDFEDMMSEISVGIPPKGFESVFGRETHTGSVAPRASGAGCIDDTGY